MEAIPEHIQLTTDDVNDAFVSPKLHKELYRLLRPRILELAGDKVKNVFGWRLLSRKAIREVLSENAKEEPLFRVSIAEVPVVIRYFRDKASEHEGEAKEGDPNSILGVEAVVYAARADGLEALLDQANKPPEAN